MHQRGPPVHANEVGHLEGTPPGCSSYNVVGGNRLGGNYHSDYTGIISPTGIGTPHNIAGTAGSVDQ